MAKLENQAKTGGSNPVPNFYLQMLKITYNNKIRKEALRHAKIMSESSYINGTKYFSYKHQSYNNEESSYLGKIAELIFQDWLAKYDVTIIQSPLDEAVYNDPKMNYDGDFVVQGLSGQLKLELKTKSCVCEPKDDYEVGTTRISGASHYIFSRIDDNHGILWLVGFMATEEFREKSTLRTKGTEVVNNSNSFQALTDEYVCKISELHDMRGLVKLII
jgi:hypothetical protein